MIIKEVGKIFLFKFKLYKVIKKLWIILIVFGLILPFLEWNVENAKQKYQFQEPSLRTKLFDINQQKSLFSSKNRIEYQQIYPGVSFVKFKGKLLNECILITFPQNISQKASIKMLYQTLSIDQNLVKNVVLLTYQNVQNFQIFIAKYFAENSNQHFGIIRVSLNLNEKIRFKQTKNQKQVKAYLEIYGKAGVHSDVDYFQSLKQLLQQLHVEWSPCEQIHQVQVLREIKKKIFWLNNIFKGSKNKISVLLDHLICQRYQSIWKRPYDPHSIFMQRGFQAGSVTFISKQEDIQKSKKMAKLTYSFIKQFSMQEDHLHSSKTYFYPVNYNFYISLTGTIFSGVIVLVAGLINVIGSLVENDNKIKSKSTIINLIEVVVFSLEYKLSMDLSCTLVYLSIKLLIFNLYSLVRILLQKNTMTNNSSSNLNMTSLEYLALLSIQILMSFYFSVFNFPIFYLNVPLILIMGFLKNLNSTLLKIIGLFSIILIIVVTALNFNSITNLNSLTGFGQNLFFDSIISSAKALSLDIKVSLIPFLYAISTYLI